MFCNKVDKPRRHSYTKAGLISKNKVDVIGQSIGTKIIENHDKRLETYKFAFHVFEF